MDEATNKPAGIEYEQWMRAVLEGSLESLKRDAGEALLALAICIDPEQQMQTVSATAWPHGSHPEVMETIVQACGQLLAQVWILERQVAGYIGEPHPAVHDRVIEAYKDSVRRMERAWDASSMVLRVKKPDEGAKA